MQLSAHIYTTDARSSAVMASHRHCKSWPCISTALLWLHTGTAAIGLYRHRAAMASHRHRCDWLIPAPRCHGITPAPLRLAYTGTALLWLHASTVTASRTARRHAVAASLLWQEPGRARAGVGKKGPGLLGRGPDGLSGTAWYWYLPCSGGVTFPSLNRDCRIIGTGSGLRCR